MAVISFSDNEDRQLGFKKSSVPILRTFLRCVTVFKLPLICSILLVLEIKFLNLVQLIM